MQFGLLMMPLHPPERSFTESAHRGSGDVNGLHVDSARWREGVDTDE